MTFLRRNDLPCHNVEGLHGWAQLRMTQADRRGFMNRCIRFRSLRGKVSLSWPELHQPLANEGITPVGRRQKIYNRTAVAHLFT